MYSKILTLSYSSFFCFSNDFSRAVADEYLKYFNFEQDTLDIALRKFLKQFSLTGETQERERVLVHFSKRYLDCNPGSFNSQGICYNLTVHSTNINLIFYFRCSSYFNLCYNVAQH